MSEGLVHERLTLLECNIDDLCCIKIFKNFPYFGFLQIV